GSGQFEYNEVADCAIAGGGDTQTVFWKICRAENGTPVVTQIAAPSNTNSALAVRVPQTILTSDPVSDCFLILTGAPQLWQKGGVSWRRDGPAWSQVTTSIPSGIVSGLCGSTPPLCNTSAYPTVR